MWSAAQRPWPRGTPAPSPPHWPPPPRTRPTDIFLGGAYPSDGGRLSPALNLVYFRGEPPVFSVTGGAASENDGPLEFTVTLSESPSPQATVNYATSDGTALEGQDYTRTSDILTFAAGETSKTVRVPLLDDRLDEEAFTLTLSEPPQGSAEGCAQ